MLNKNILLPALLVTCISLISGCAELDKLRYKLNNSNGLSQHQIAAGLKEALRVGSTTVVKKLSTKNGFNKDPVVHINLPKNLNKVQQALKKIGYSHYLDDLELKLNRAAEKATPRAKTLFFNAIKQLTWQDVKNIYHGPDDAATRYFQKNMTPSLKKDMYPVINKVLAEVGAIQSYERSMKKYQSIPFVPDVRADMTDYTITKTLDAIFYYLAKEETGIRKDPAKRTTKLLRQVFGNN
jgi:hypothetical protein